MSAYVITIMDNPQSIQAAAAIHRGEADAVVSNNAAHSDPHPSGPEM